MSGGGPSRFKNIAVFCGVRRSVSRRPAGARRGPGLLQHTSLTDGAHIFLLSQAAHGARPVYGEAAEALAQEMVKRNIGLVYGGGSVGLMGKARADLFLFFSPPLSHRRDSLS